MTRKILGCRTVSMEQYINLRNTEGVFDIGTIKQEFAMLIPSDYEDHSNWLLEQRKLVNIVNKEEGEKTCLGHHLRTIL